MVVISWALLRSKWLRYIGSTVNAGDGLSREFPDDDTDEHGRRAGRLSAQMTGSPARRQGAGWLIDAASRGGLKGLESVSPRPGAPTTELWESLARAAGVGPGELARAVAAAMHLNVADVETFSHRTTRLVPERVARRFSVLPLRDDDRYVYVATSDPTNVDAEQQIEFASGRRVVNEIAEPTAIGRAINAAYSANLVVDAVLAAVGRDGHDAVKVVEEAAPAPVPVSDVDTEPIVKLTSVILRDAINGDASDIHIEPGAAGGVVRFRIDGMMRLHMQLPSTVLVRIVSRIKVMSRLNIADRLRPQDGRARIQVDGRMFDLRVSTVPTRDAEKAVIRILRPLKESTLEAVRIPAEDVVRIRSLLAHRDGIVAITGPTGSGKTTTIYSAIREIAQRDVNVVTVEDPVEYEVAGITQIQVDVKRGLTFGSALRSILRQDPDVIFVGEIRDLETATIAVQAAMTGHLVIATVHANDAIGAVTRLSDLGVDTASIAATLRGAVAQRLVRRLCTECSVPVADELTDEEVALSAQYGARPVRRAVGCRACSNTGYRGRLPIAEVAHFGARIGEEMLAGASPAAIQRSAVAAGMRTLRDAALARLASGETTLQEIDRVLGSAEHGTDAAPRAPKPAAATEPEKTSVLLVEDDPVQRLLVRTFLTAGGMSVSEAVDGRAALEQLRTAGPFSLILTDLYMDRLDGAGLLRAVRAEFDPELPVIVLTGSGVEAAELELLDAGATDYIRKPIDAPRLIARVRAALRRRSTAEPLHG